MKKITILIGALFMSTALVAQDVQKESSSLESFNEYKQNTGMKSLELSFDPAAIFNSSNTGPAFSLQNLGIKVRKFKSPASAFRIGFNLNFSNRSIITQQDPVLKDKITTFGAFIRPGIEKHFKGTDRLSPYIGMEFIVGFQTSTIVSEITDGENKFKNPSTSDGFSLGIGGLAGFDYYIARNLFLGLELNYSLTYFNQFKEKTILSDGSETTDGGGSAIVLAPSAYAFFRIG